MKGKTSEKQALASVESLDKIAGQYEQTAKTLRKLAKGLRGVMDWAGTLPDKAPAAKGKRKTKKRKMSAEARQRIADAAKKRWAAKKAQGGGE